MVSILGAGGKIAINLRQYFRNRQNIADCLFKASVYEAVHHFLLSEKEAVAGVEHQIPAIVENWTAVCEEADLSETDRTLLCRRQYLNTFDFENLDLESEFANIPKIASDVRVVKKG